MDNNQIKNFGIGLGSGLLIGIVVAFLIAPQKGSETRKLIQKQSKITIATVKDKLSKKKTEVDKVHNP